MICGCCQVLSGYLCIVLTKGQEINGNSGNVAIVRNLRLQYSIYAGRHFVPGLEGLLLECTADVNRVWSPLGVPRWSSTARLITKYLVNMIKVCFCSNNDGDY